MKTKITLPKGGCIKIANDGCGVSIDAPEVQIEGDMRVISAASPTEPRPFDLAAAKAGAPLVTRDGRKAVFVAHDTGARNGFRLIVRLEGAHQALFYPENGKWSGDKESPADLFMAPKPKRTVWANTYYHDTETEARAAAGRRTNLVAVPVEIEE